MYITLGLISKIVIHHYLYIIHIVRVSLSDIKILNIYRNCLKVYFKIIQNKVLLIYIYIYKSIFA